jgi:hypothetical protein
MKFGSWTYDGLMVDLRHMNQVGLDLRHMNQVGCDLCHMNQVG